ncbi:hypothetical protein ACH4O0_06820, partial [Streptomyces luteogriseus]
EGSALPGPASEGSALPGPALEGPAPEGSVSEVSGQGAPCPAGPDPLDGVPDGPPREGVDPEGLNA